MSRARNKRLRKNINMLFGKKKLSKKKPILHKATEYPIRPVSLGKSRGSETGVGGWRSNYHRPESAANSGNIIDSLLASYDERRNTRWKP